MPNAHAAEFVRCMIQMDVPQARKLWAHVFPHMPQPESDEDMRMVLHLARTKARSVPIRMRLHSKAWLKERETGRIVNAVGISVAAPMHRRAQGLAIRDAMIDSVQASVKAGLDLDEDASEVRRRMIEARDKERGKLGTRG